MEIQKNLILQRHQTLHGCPPRLCALNIEDELGNTVKWYRVEKKDLTQLQTRRSIHAALRVHLAIMKKMLVGGFDLDNKKRNSENTIWDIYQLFCVSNATLNAQEMIFATADSWLHEISSESGMQSN